jgi:FAD/FMN-containing dehydrogenase
MDGAIPGFRGEVLRPEDEAYSVSRRIWNGAIDRHPALIARCADEEDASAALEFALTRGLPVSVRGGGHNVSGSALAEGGVVIDFSALRGVAVDAEGMSVRVQPGALWGDVDAATQEHGLAVPAGIVTHTGVAGLTVGGGFGWLSRSWGLTSDNLLSVRMLLADGSRVHASEEENPDLFWAVRGGGGNFGIVTEFRFGLHRLGTHVLAGPILFRADQAREAIGFYREFIAEAPDELSVYMNLRTAPPFDWVPEHLRGTDVLLVIPFFAGDPRQGEDLLRPLRAFGPPAADLVRYKPYLEHQAMFDAGVPHHWGYYWKSHYLPPLTDAAVEVLLEHSWVKSSPASYTLLFHMGGAIASRDEDSSAAGGRDAAHAMNINAAWPAGGPSHPDVIWCRDYLAAMEPYATGGVYVNFLHNDDGEDRIRAAYGARYDRLAKIKAQYDPENIFRSNQNIRPSRTGPSGR